MLEQLKLGAGLFSLLLGTGLVCDAVWNPDVSQTFMLLGGAALIALGLICVWYVVKDGLEFRKNYRCNNHD